MKHTLYFLISLMMLSSSAWAESLFSRTVNGQRLFNKFLDQGVPEPALTRLFEFIDLNNNKNVMVKAKFRPGGGKSAYMSTRDLTIRGDYVALIDFSLPSDERRMYFLHLKTGQVDRHFVAHGKGSGVRFAGKFSNIDGSKMSSLGLYLVGNTYWGTHGESLNLHGIEKSNDAAASRDIVMHAASYVTPEYVNNNGRLGRSWGCPAVAPTLIQKMIRFLKDGGIIYAYHKDLMKKTASSPVLQEVRTNDDQEDVDLPEEEESVRKDGVIPTAPVEPPAAAEGTASTATKTSITPKAPTSTSAQESSVTAVK